MDKITLVITSCGRIDLLERTIESFFKFNTNPIEEVILIDDSLNKGMHEYLKKTYPEFLYIFNETKLGQPKSIARAYSIIKTPYIFHCEDDWEFYKEGFIEKSLKILQDNENILQVWIRPKSDHVGHNIGEQKEGYNLVKQETHMNGFSFNPGLRRLKEYKMIGSYEKIGKENEIGLFYKMIGYRTAWLTEGYVKHIGYGRHCSNNLKHKA